MYRTANDYYQSLYGCKVYKLSIDAGFTCPNRDGTVGTGGCIFCDGSGAFAGKGESITDQLQRAKVLVEKKNKGGKYIAYFQAFTNTYAPCEKLRALYTEAANFPDVVGIAIGTRPDCLSDEVLDVLGSIGKPVSVELGLQTANEESAAFIRRGYPLFVYLDAVKRLKARNIDVVTHIILGLPGENMEDAVETTKTAIEAGTDGLKFHLLHILRGTDLEKEYNAGKFRCLTMEEYGDYLLACLKKVPSHVVVHRITGDGAKKDLIAPLWSADKKRVLNYLNNLLKEKTEENI